MPVFKALAVVAVVAVVAEVALVAEVADVAVEALPFNVAVIVPAEKFPDASRATIADAVLALVAFEVTVNVWADDPLNVAEPDKPVPDTASVKLLLTCEAVEALPDKAAVIVPADKFPDASRATTLEAVLAEVASTAIVPLVVIVPPVRYVPAVMDVTVPEVIVLHAKAEPFQFRYELDTVGAVANAVVPEAD